MLWNWNVKKMTMHGCYHVKDNKLPRNQGILQKHTHTLKLSIKSNSPMSDETNFIKSKHISTLHWLKSIVVNYWSLYTLNCPLSPADFLTIFLSSFPHWSKTRIPTLLSTTTNSPLGDTATAMGSTISRCVKAATCLPSKVISATILVQSCTEDSSKVLEEGCLILDPCSSYGVNHWPIYMA